VETTTWLVPLVATLVGGAVVPLLSKIAEWRKGRDDREVKDRELLSADEKDFRRTILEQLRHCMEQHTMAQEHAAKCDAENAALRMRVAMLEMNVDTLRQRVTT
jgi:hypothetical protein